jgi:outer membrane receptor protein involved in Fe transport
LKGIQTVAVSGFLLVVGIVHPDAQVRGQGIEGIIYDAVTSAPLGNVNVSLLNTRRGGVSDPSGKFFIRGIDPGTYRIRVTRIGYETQEKSVEVQENAPTWMTLYLRPKAIVIDSVGIVGRRITRDILSVSSVESRGLETAQSQITRLEIRRQGAVSVIDAMKYVPGGLTETRGRKVKQFFSVRGQTYPYPDYAVNGIWINEFHEVPYFFTSSDIENIEVDRSSAALLTGLSGLAGVIKISTREYDSLETSLLLEAGSYGTYRGHLSHGGRFGNFSYATGLGYDRTSGPKGMHAAEGMLNASARVRWELSPSFTISANLFHLNGHQQLRLAVPPAAQRYINMVQSYEKIRTTIVNAKLSYRPVSWTSSELQLLYSGKTPVFLNEVNGVRTDEGDFNWGLNFIQALSFSHSNIMRFGGLYNHWLAPNGKRFYTGRRCDTETLSFVVTDEQELGPVTLDAGFRWSRTYMNEYGAFNIEGSGGKFTNVDPIIDEWQSPVIQGSLGMVYDLSTSMSLHLNAAIGQVKPREGSLDTAMNIPANEFRIKLDLGWMKRWERGGHLVLTSFLVKQDNALEYSGTTLEHPVTGSTMELYLNRDQDQFGLEMDARTFRMLNLFSAFYNLTWMSSGIYEDGDRIRNREHPAWISNAGIYLERAGFDLNLFGKYVSAFENDRFADPAEGPQPLGDFFSMDMTGGYTIKRGISTRIYFNITNLTNCKYSTVVGYPDFGRRFRAGVRFVI